MSLPHRISAITGSTAGRLLVVRGVLGILAVGGLIALLAAPKPWTYAFPADQRIPVETYAGVFLWWAGLINLIGLTALAATASWWMQPLGAAPVPTGASSGPRWFWPGVLAAMVVCGAVNAPRMVHSLWDDEEYSLRRIILGSYRQTDGGSVKLKEVPWSHTFWFYGKPNNHFVNSLTARVTNSLWRAVTRPAGLQFSEPALRLPAFLAGVASLAAWACLLRALGFGGAGVLVAWLLALHPWHTRFVPELRGYAFVFLFLALAGLTAVRALQSGTWRRWAAFGAAQFLLFYSWPGMVPTLALLNLGLGGAIVAARENRVPQLARWLVTGLVSGMVALQLYLPCVAQLLNHLDDWDAKGLGAPWLKNVGARLLSGMPWAQPGSEFPELANLSPWVAGPVVALAVGVLGFGVVRCWTAGAQPRWMVVVLLVPGPLMYGMAIWKDTHLFEWYMVFLVPGLVALAAVGLQALATRIPQPAVRGLAMVLVVAGFAVLTHPARAVLMARPVQSLRDSVQQTRSTLNPHDPRNAAIVTLTILATPEVYDPNVRRVKSAAEFLAVLRQADARGLPVFVNHGYRGMLAVDHPEISRWLARPDCFVLDRAFPGMEPMFDREVLRYQAGSLDTPP